MRMARAFGRTSMFQQNVPSGFETRRRPNQLGSNRFKCLYIVLPTTIDIRIFVFLFGYTRLSDPSPKR